MVWIPVDGGYDVRVRGTGTRAEVVCRNQARNRELARVPTKVRALPAVVRLRDLCSWLGEHEETVHTWIRTWMLRSLPIPTDLLTLVWDDPVWRHTLEGIVVAPADTPDTPWGEHALLNRVDPHEGVEVIGPDGERAWLDTPLVAVPHPARLDVGLWCALLDSLGREQGHPQLSRRVWRRPEGMGPEVTRVRLDFGFMYDNPDRFRQAVDGLGGYVDGPRAHLPVHGDPRHGPREPFDAVLPLDKLPMMVHLRELAWNTPGRYVDDIAWSEGIHLLMELFDGRYRVPWTDHDAVPEILAAQRTGPTEPGVPAPSRDAFLRTGGIAAAIGPLSDNESGLRAQRLTHPHLDDHVVILVRDEEAKAERVARSAQGFAWWGERTAGTVARRPPGFLARVLRHHPAHSGVAVSLLPRLRKVTARATSKPGRARTALNRIADELAQEAPELLPAFYDECSRILARVLSPSYAAGFFTKARKTESAHPVDEDVVVDAYLSYGVVTDTPKDVRKHPAVLTARNSPEDAYRHHRTLVTRWCGAGRAASGDLAAGLAKLARAAKHVPEGPEDLTAVTAMLANGSLAAAPTRVWRFFLPFLVTAAHWDARVRDLLATQLPIPEKDTPQAQTTAVRALTDTLVEAHLTRPFTGTGRLDGVHALRWLEGFVRAYPLLEPHVPGLAELLADVGHGMRAAGLSCDAEPLLRGAHQRIDLVEFLVSLGIPLHHRPQETPKPLSIGLIPDLPRSWLRAVSEGGLPALYADPGWRPQLRSALLGDPGDLLGLGRPAENPTPATTTEDPHVPKGVVVGPGLGGGVLAEVPALAARLLTEPGLSDVVDDVLAEHAEAVPSGGLPVLYGALRDAERFTVTPPPERVRSHVTAIVTKGSPAAALALTLRSGILDELATPWLEKPETLVIFPGDLVPFELGERWALYRRRYDTYKNQVIELGTEGPVSWLDNSGAGFAWAGKCPTCARQFLDTGRPFLFQGDCWHREETFPALTATETVRLPGGEELILRRTAPRLMDLTDAKDRVVGRYVIGDSGLERQGYASVAPGNHRYAAGSCLVPPPGWWGRLPVRDSGGSAALRAVDEEKTRELMSVANPEFSARLVSLTDQAPPRYPLAERHAHLGELAARVRPVLPQITDERLLTGVAAMVWTAVECRERLTALA